MNGLMQDLALLLPELTVALAAIALLMVGAFRGQGATSFVHLAAVFALVAALHFVLAPVPTERVSAFAGMFVQDGFTRFAKLTLLTASLLVLVMLATWLKDASNRQFEFPVLVLFATLGLMLMISADNFIAVYMAMELASLSLYVLAAFRRDSLLATEAGIKYFVLGALASGMMLFGISLIYGFAGSVSFAALGQLWQAQTALHAGLVIGLVLVIVGFCFKISAVPFHMWTPDVYQGAPTPVTAFFSVAPKVAALALFSRVLLEPFGTLIDQWQLILIVVSIASMAVGALGAIMQTNIKRMLAYSSIGHVGFALVGLSTGTVAGLQGLLVYLALYVVMSVGAFACVLQLRRNGEYVEDIRELAGLSKTAPGLAFALAVCMFSMAGIPPFAGFFGKMYVFLAAVQSGLWLLAVLGVLASVVACYYYLRIVKLMYFDEARPAFDGGVAPSLRLLMWAMVVVTALFFAVPDYVVEPARAAAQMVLLP